MLFNLV